MAGFACNAHLAMAGYRWHVPTGLYQYRGIAHPGRWVPPGTIVETRAKSIAYVEHWLVGRGLQAYHEDGEEFQFEEKIE